LRIEERQSCLPQPKSGVVPDCFATEPQATEGQLHAPFLPKKGFFLLPVFGILNAIKNSLLTCWGYGGSLDIRDYMIDDKTIMVMQTEEML
jgi:hypothetical protein